MTIQVPTKEPWAGVRVLVTGHTGFKGAWLSLWLEQLGATVSGLSLPAHPASLYHRAHFEGRWEEASIDIRDPSAVAQAINRFNPQIVFHLAAQPLVGSSYDDPVYTFGTNVMGTVNVLNSLGSVSEALGCIVVTTDKVYRNPPHQRSSFREEDPLGGHDPYSASKSSVEHVAAAWTALASVGYQPRVVTVRAGNVVGGGDYAENRLIPDLVRAFASGSPARVRNPNSTRPWQHVLDPLQGYLFVGERMLRGEPLPASVNFGPERDHSVRAVADFAAHAWGDGATWVEESSLGPPEAATLALDSSLAKLTLGWRPTWGVRESVSRSLAWWKSVLRGQSAEAECLRDLEDFSIARFRLGLI